LHQSAASGLCRVRDALQLKTTDAVWLLLMVLQHYETLCEEIPEQIAWETALRPSRPRRSDLGVPLGRPTAKPLGDALPGISDPVG